ncbi:MAG: hypothetical protein LBG15_03025 [Dysgonamonadaceae bacterium]|jgi:hypothetical protein|nr:hypothetical protein [Dysgonamonadaceae bacterium]
MKTTKQILFLAVLGCMMAPVAAQTVNVTLQCGQSYTINSTVAATATDGLTYRWLENGSIVHETAATLLVPTTKSVGIYTYVRQAKSTDCTDWQNSNEFTVEVKNKEGIDGVCLGGVMWAKYYVGEPGSFVATIDARGKLYQFNRNVAYPPDPPYTAPTELVSELVDWEVINSPCVAPWRIPTEADAKALLANTITAYSFNGAFDLATAWVRSPGMPNPNSQVEDNAIFFAGGNRVCYGGNYSACCYIQFWCTKSTAETYALSIGLAYDNALHYNSLKNCATPIRCVQ